MGSECPQRTVVVRGGFSAQRKQYGLKHRVTATIHARMGDTLHKVAVEVVDSDNNTQVWDKAQVVVMLSRTKMGQNSIFVGDKRKTISTDDFNIGEGDKIENSLDELHGKCIEFG